MAAGSEFGPVALNLPLCEAKVHLVPGRLDCRDGMLGAAKSGAIFGGGAGTIEPGGRDHRFPSRRRNAPTAHTTADTVLAGQTGHAIAKLAVSPILLLTWTALEGASLV